MGVTDDPGSEPSSAQTPQTLDRGTRSCPPASRKQLQIS